MYSFPGLFCPETFNVIDPAGKPATYANQRNGINVIDLRQGKFHLFFSLR